MVTAWLTAAAAEYQQYQYHNLGQAVAPLGTLPHLQLLKCSQVQNGGRWWLATDGVYRIHTYIGEGLMTGLLKALSEAPVDKQTKLVPTLRNVELGHSALSGHLVKVTKYLWTFTAPLNPPGSTTLQEPPRVCLELQDTSYAGPSSAVRQDVPHLSEHAATLKWMSDVEVELEKKRVVLGVKKWEPKSEANMMGRDTLNEAMGARQPSQPAPGPAKAAAVPDWDNAGDYAIPKKKKRKTEKSKLGDAGSANQQAPVSTEVKSVPISAATKVVEEPWGKTPQKKSKKRKAPAAVPPETFAFGFSQTADMAQTASETQKHPFASSNAGDGSFADENKRYGSPSTSSLHNPSPTPAQTVSPRHSDHHRSSNQSHPSRSSSNTASLSQPIAAQPNSPSLRNANLPSQPTTSPPPTSLLELSEIEGQPPARQEPRSVPRTTTTAWKVGRTSAVPPKFPLESSSSPSSASGSPPVFHSARRSALADLEVDGDDEDVLELKEDGLRTGKALADEEEEEEERIPWSSSPQMRHIAVNDADEIGDDSEEEAMPPSKSKSSSGKRHSPTTEVEERASVQETPKQSQTKSLASRRVAAKAKEAVEDQPSLCDLTIQHVARSGFGPMDMEDEKLPVEMLLELEGSQFDLDLADFRASQIAPEPSVPMPVAITENDLVQPPADEALMELDEVQIQAVQIPPRSNGAGSSTSLRPPLETVEPDGVRHPSPEMSSQRDITRSRRTAASLDVPPPPTPPTDRTVVPADRDSIVSKEHLAKKRGVTRGDLVPPLNYFARQMLEDIYERRGVWKR